MEKEILREIVLRRRVFFGGDRIVGLLYLWINSGCDIMFKNEIILS